MRVYGDNVPAEFDAPRRERAVLEWLEARKLPAPRLVASGAEPCPHALLDWIDGASLAPTKVDDAVLRQLGAALRELHSASVPNRQGDEQEQRWHEALEWSGDTTLLEAAEFDAPTIAAAAAAGDAESDDPLQLAQLAESLRSTWTAAETLASALQDEFAALPRAVVVHGDAHVGNVLVRDSNSVRFVDWEAAHIGNAFDDIASVASVVFPPLDDARRALLFDAAGVARDADSQRAFELFLFRKRARATNALARAAMKSPDNAQLVRGAHFFVSQLAASISSLSQ